MKPSLFQLIAIAPLCVVCRLPDARAAGDMPVLLAPSPGRPVFVRPGGELEFTALVKNASEPPRITLVSHTFPPHRHTLQPADDAAQKLRLGQPQTVKVPEEIPERTYDLEMRCGATLLRARHCVAVAAQSPAMRVVHLSNMNLGEISAPQFDTRLIDEVNLVRPTLIVATGDYIDVSADDVSRRWTHLMESFARFDAPVLMACGDHDEIGFYSRHAAASPIGVVDVGNYRAVVLLDHHRQPLLEDEQQLEWLEHLLEDSTSERALLIVSHAQAPNLLRRWLNDGTLIRKAPQTGLRAWFAGGHGDWDGVEYAELLSPVASLTYFATHQSSTATPEGASGVSHYRVVDFADGKVVPAVGSQNRRPSASLPVGRLGVTFHNANDGSQREVAFTAVNNHARRINRLGVRVLLRRNGNETPWCRGAELTQVVGLGAVWECHVSFDLPGRGALRAVVGLGPPPPTLNVSVSFATPPEVAFARFENADGTRFESSDLRPIINLTNNGGRAIAVSPIVRLDGNTIAYRRLNRAGPYALSYRMTLEPDGGSALQLDFSALRITAGRHELQLYLKGGPAWAPICHPLDIVVRE